jgi:hypothetical protein
MTQGPALNRDTGVVRFKSFNNLMRSPKNGSILEYKIITIKMSSYKSKIIVKLFLFDYWQFKICKIVRKNAQIICKTGEIP